MSVGDLIIKYWPIILALSGLIVHAIWHYFRVENMEEILKNHSQRMNGIDARITGNEKIADGIMVTLERIETTLAFVRDAIAELKRK